MKNKIEISIISVLLFSLSLYAENYYWYKGEKINLVVDSNNINITTNNDANLSSLIKKFDETSKIKQLERSKNNTSLFSVELASRSQYKNIIDSLKSNKNCIFVFYNLDFFIYK